VSTPVAALDPVVARRRRESVVEGVAEQHVVEGRADGMFDHAADGQAQVLDAR
jgi:hypothetical protein